LGPFGLDSFRTNVESNLTGKDPAFVSGAGRRVDFPSKLGRRDWALRSQLPKNLLYGGNEQMNREIARVAKISFKVLLASRGGDALVVFGSNNEVPQKTELLNV
jgi:hypothetical protein